MVGPSTLVDGVAGWVARGEGVGAGVWVASLVSSWFGLNAWGSSVLSSEG